jgi:hypothetical protein
MTDQSKHEDIARLLDTDSGKLDLLGSMPYLADEIYSHLPKLLKKACKIFKSKRERDIFLLSALPVLAGIMRNVSGLYDNRTVYPNIYVIIIAPAASGKSALAFAKALGMFLHKLWMQESRNKQTSGKIKLLFIPGNTSSASILEHLYNNEGFGVLFDSEMDTLGSTFKNEWGNYSDILRKGFHGEPISASRKTNKEYIEIVNPQISMALSGTPNQVLGLIPSVENGLFSRCIFYVFKSAPSWRPVNPDKEKINYDEHFSKLGVIVASMYEMLSKSPTEVLLQEHQWDELNGFFDYTLRTSNTFHGYDSSSIVKRQGVILFKIIMILTALRKFEDGVTETKVYCTDTDFKIALSMIKELLVHSFKMYELLPSGGITEKKEGKKGELFEFLPEEFQRKDAITKGELLGIAIRSIDRYLQEFLKNGLLDSTEIGHYKKVRKPKMTKLTDLTKREDADHK